MLDHPAFREQDPAALRALVREIGLATLVVATETGLEATPLPLHLTEDGGALLGHVARANPLVGLLTAGARPAVACFLGPHAYVSPSWYPSKAATGRAVPTWNYVAVQCHGALALESDPAALRALLTQLTDQHEAGRPHPWRIDDAPEDYLTQQMKGIVGLRLTVTRWEGKRKLSQNRDAADRAGVIAGLTEAGETASAAAIRP